MSTFDEDFWPVRKNVFQWVGVGAVDGEPATLREHAIASLIVVDGEWFVPWKAVPVLVLGLRLLSPVSSVEQLAVIVGTIIFLIPCEVLRTEEVVCPPFGVVQSIGIEQPDVGPVRGVFGPV